MKQKYIFTLTCKDDFGIVASVSNALFHMGAFIIESSQFSDPSSNQFFMRIMFALENKLVKEQLPKGLTEVIERFSLDWQLNTADYRLKTLLMVSKESHCLNDILHRAALGSLPIHIKGVISNHARLMPMATWYQVPFYHWPIIGDDFLKLVAKEEIDLLVLARYMQVLTPDFCQKFSGRAINIHHSFLPSFKGARPYNQAFERGVKVVGATAHYVTPELDEGPIIEQETIRVSHAHTPERLVEIGRDVECMVLSRAIKLHAEQRILLNGHKTVVFY